VAGINLFILTFFDKKVNKFINDDKSWGFSFWNLKKRWNKQST
jgi:hypothetical protein